MLFCALLAFLTGGGDEVDGLRAGESVSVFDAGSWLDEDGEAEYARPRVLDARTGVPLADVLIETWTEFGVEPFGQELRLDATTTGRDGCARVRIRVGRGTADKVRLSKAGYASRTVSSSDMWRDEVRLYSAMPLEGRVLDLDGKPVGGALVRTRETCAHAVPASQTRTDALGRFHMQDFPALGDGAPELEVVDLHHELLYHLDADDLRREISFYGSLDLYVARRRPVELQLVDPGGEPMPGRHILTQEAPVVESWTGLDGRCTLPPTLYPFSGTYLLAHPESKYQGLVVPLVDGLVARVSPGMFDAARPTQDGRLTVRIEGVGEGEQPPPIVIVPARGPFIEGSTESTGNERLPLGRARVYVGGDFSGWRLESREVEVTTAAQDVVFKPRREPRVTVKLDTTRTFERLLVQAGDHSLESNDAARGNDVGVVVPVPPGAPITVFWQLDDGCLRRARLPALERDATVDLGTEASLVRHGMNESPERTGVLRFAVTDKDGHAISAAEGRVYAGASSFDFAPGDAGVFSWPLASHTAYRAAFHAPGCVDALVEGVVPIGGDAKPATIVLTRRAHLELRGDVTRVELGGLDPDPVEGGFDLDVAPGPLVLRVQRAERPPLALDLVLSEGETRRIDVR